MTTTLNHVRTIVCASCNAAFSYEYSGGRNRRKCDRPECNRIQVATRKRRSRDARKERPDGYRPTDYPHLISAALPKSQLDHLRAATTEHYFRSKLRTQPEGVGTVGSDDGESRSSIRDLLAAGHGYVWDDVRPDDEYPLRYIRSADRGFVKYWMAKHSFPLAGMAGPAVLLGDDAQYIIGRKEIPNDTIPPRITRRFCSENALTSMVTFSLYI